MPDSNQTRTLYHVYDPMCSWCYAFRPLWQEISEQLPSDIEVKYILGGLAPDSDVPMPESMQTMLISTWERITQTVPGTQFNFDFWTKNTPRRSTYPSCRAIIAARLQDPTKERDMLSGIQDAYYQQAKNPSNDDTLIQVAIDNGLDGDKFAADLHSNTTQKSLADELAFARSIGGDSFPSLILRDGDRLRLLMLSYTEKDKILQQLG